jgi:hypothetical protein
MGKALRCRVGRHRWERTFDDERKIRVKVCRSCGLRMSRGWPTFVADMGGAGGGGTG